MVRKEVERRRLGEGIVAELDESSELDEIEGLFEGLGSTMPDKD